MDLAVFIERDEDAQAFIQRRVRQSDGISGYAANPDLFVCRWFVACRREPMKHREAPFGRLSTVAHTAQIARSALALASAERQLCMPALAQ